MSGVMAYTGNPSTREAEVVLCFVVLDTAPRDLCVLSNVLPMSYIGRPCQDYCPSLLLVPAPVGGPFLNEHFRKQLQVAKDLRVHR